METERYDFAPVFSGEQVLGLVSRERLAMLAGGGEPLRPDDPEIRRHAVIETRPPLDVLLDAMADCPVRIVVDSPTLTPPWTRRISYGIVTLSDLNKHPVRVVIYEILAGLEMAAADLVRAVWGNSVEWVMKLDRDESKARILGYWKLAELEGVDTGPVTGATLAELLRAIGCRDGLLASPGFRSVTNYHKATGSLPEWRNRVMHPVRPLLTKPAELTKLKTDLLNALDLTHRIRSRLGAESHSGANEGSREP